jgi:hypothetical protein
VKTLGFEHLKEMYHDDPYFKEAYEACVNPGLRDRSQWDEYMIQDMVVCLKGASCAYQSVR